MTLVGTVRLKTGIATGICERYPSFIYGGVVRRVADWSVGIRGAVEGRVGAGRLVHVAPGPVQVVLHVGRVFFLVVAVAVLSLFCGPQFVY